MPSCTTPPKLSSPCSAVATLLLIENSSSMSTVWSMLRDRYLPTVLRKVQGSGSSTAPPSTFFIESSSLEPPSGLTTPPRLKLYHDNSCELRFEHDLSSRISTERIHSSIDLLTSITIRAQPVTLNLVIVAASTPLTDHQDVNLNHPPDVHSKWLQLAERMAQQSVQCHLVLKSQEDISPFERMFQETLRLRNFREVISPFNIEPTEAIVRLSETINGVRDAGAVIQASARPSLRRSRTRPLESSNGKRHAQYATSSQKQPEMPSLVAQLQQRHGLTKKKVYGVKPPRTPFFRDEPRSDPYRSPVPMSLAETSMTTPVTMTPGGRSAPLSRLDRMARMSHRSTTDTSGRYHPCGSKLPSGDIGCPVAPSYMSPREEMPASNYQYRPAPTIAPTPQISYPVATHLDSEGIYSQPIFESGISSQWSTSPNAYVSQSHDISSQSRQEDYISNLPTPDVHRTSRLLAAIRNSPPKSQSPITSVNSKSSDPSAVTSYDEPTSLKCNASAQCSASSPSKAASNPKDDEPFTFDPEYIAATAVMFRQEVLPAFPEYAELVDSYGPPSTKRGNGAVPQEYGLECDYSMLPYLPASKAGQLFAAKYSVAAYQQHSAAEAGGMPLALSEPTSLQYPTHSAGTSSLTGWAG